MKYSRSEHEKARKFTETELEKYSDYSYQDVVELGLGKRISIESPPGFEQFNFAMEVRNNDDGGLEVSVFYHDIPPYEEVPSWFKDAIGTEDISHGESSFRVWYEIYKDGRKVWPSFEHPDGED